MEVGTKAFYKGEQEPVTVIHNEDGYIVIRRKNGAEVEPVKLSDLSDRPPAELFKKQVIDEKQWAKVFAHIREAKPEMIDAGKLEYKISIWGPGTVTPEMRRQAASKFMPWDALTYAAKCQFISVFAGMSIDRLYKEYR